MTLTVVLFGTASAFHATRLELAPTSPAARGLIIGQVALSLVLLVGVGSVRPQ